MKGIVSALIFAVFFPVTVTAGALESDGAFLFADGGTATMHEIVVGDPAAVDTLVFTYGGSGCVDLGRDWLPMIARAMDIPARFLALNKRYVVTGHAHGGGSEMCSSDFRTRNLPRYWMADYMEFISRTLEAQPGRWNKVVLVGASEGGALATRIARSRSDITHLVVVGDGGWSMRDNLSSMMGGEVVEAAWRDIARRPDSTEILWLGHPYRYWFDTFDHAPLADYLALQIPVLIGFGERDRSVPVASAYEVLRAAQAAGKRNIGLMVYPGADHSLQTEGHDHLREFLQGAGQGIATGKLD